jgi:hypothetical protein
VGAALDNAPCAHARHLPGHTCASPRAPPPSARRPNPCRPSARPAAPRAWRLCSSRAPRRPSRPCALPARCCPSRASSPSRPRIVGRRHLLAAPGASFGLPHALRAVRCMKVSIHACVLRAAGMAEPKSAHRHDALLIDVQLLHSSCPRETQLRSSRCVRDPAEVFALLSGRACSPTRPEISRKFNFIGHKDVSALRCMTRSRSAPGPNLSSTLATSALHPAARTIERI